jgi:hypothetical protein
MDATLGSGALESSLPFLSDESITDDQGSDDTQESTDAGDDSGEYNEEDPPDNSPLVFLSRTQLSALGLD